MQDATSAIETPAQMLARAAALHATRPFLIAPDPARSLSYARTQALTTRVGGGLAAQAVRAGDRVLIAATNRPEAIVLFFAALRLGAVPALVSPGVRAHGLGQIIVQTDPVLVALDEATGHLRESLAGRRTMWLGAPSGGRCDAAFGDLAADPGAPSVPPALAAPPRPAAPAFLVLTSGSTGAPRAVTVTHANVAFLVGAIQERLQYRPDDVIGLFLPLAFDYGLYQLLLAMNVGAGVLVESPASAGPFLASAAAAHHVTVLPLIPSQLAATLAMLDRRVAGALRVRAITSTGEHLSPALIDRTLDRIAGVRLYSMYGLTECKRATILLPEELSLKKDSVGRALRGTSIHAIDQRGTPLPPGQRGELLVRGAHVSCGYWGAPKETRDRFIIDPAGGDPALRTGDFGSVDQDGFVYVSGRRADLFKHRGIRMSPIELEDAARRLPEVVDAAAAKCDEGDRLCLFVTTTDSRATPHTVLIRLRDEIEAEKLPDEIRIVPSLPHTAQGKVDRAQLPALLPGPGAPA